MGQLTASGWLQSIAGMNSVAALPYEAAACRAPKFLRTLEQDMRRKTEAPFNAPVMQHHLDFYPTLTRLASPQDVLNATEID